VTEGIEVLPRSTIQTASAKAIAGKISSLVCSERMTFACIPKRLFPSKNQIKA
jgi:hypothetical protein